MKLHALINPDYEAEIGDALKKVDIRPMAVPRCPRLHPALCGHPDLQFFIHDGIIFTHPDLPRDFMNLLNGVADLRISPVRLFPSYPGDCPYNIAVVGNHAFHRTDITPGPVSAFLHEKGMDILHVRQGYSRCSTMTVNGSAPITADRGIHEQALGAGLHSLLITPGNIDLSGFGYGFIGGTSGSYGGKIYLCGSIGSHPDGDRMRDFIERSGIGIVELFQGSLIDTGSILIFHTE